MHALPLPERPRILCLGAHCDDIEIGCGGTLLALRERHPELAVTWVVFAATPEREKELRASAERFLGVPPDERGAGSVLVERFRDGFLPYQGAALKDAFERLKTRFDPDLIFTHTSGDAHQDHRQVCELTWNTWRDHLILEYEVPKWDGDLGRPNAYVALSERQASAKIEYLLASYRSQAGRDWFEAETFRALLRLRGMEARAPERYAEAFFARKLVLAPAR